MASSTPRSATVEGAPVRAQAARPSGGAGRMVRRFTRRHPLGAVGAVVVVAFLAAGLLAPFIAPRDPNQIDIQATLRPPSRAYPLGTDNLGRDLLSRVLYGARVSLFISLTAVFAGGTAGVTLGILAGYYRTLEMPVMRTMDMLLAFPGLILALTFVAVLGRGVLNVIIAIAVVEVPQFARLAHGLTLSIKEKAYIESAVAIGQRDTSILRRHVLPNCLPPLVVQVSLLIPGAIMTGASLAFLGLGVPPPAAEWGAMLQNSLQWARLAPHVMIIPGLALMLVVFGFNVLGDALRDAMDPRLRKG